jgi:glutamate racemase
MHDQLAPNQHTRLAATDRIGVFDSGVGGLTVLHEIYRQLPKESILYFGDTARVPYGTRSAAEILQFAREILDWMAQEPVKMAIVACNTSSALALETVQGEYDFPILGVIWPGARAAARQGRRIGVIATPATIDSNAYLKAITEANPQTEVYQVACPEFVPLIEANRIQDAYTLEVARNYINPLLEKGIDTLVYGCTHYPHLEPVLRQFVPPHVNFINPAAHVVTAAARELNFLGIPHHDSALPTQYQVSGDPDRFAHLAAQWLPTKPVVEQISLPVISG